MHGSHFQVCACDMLMEKTNKLNGGVGVRAEKSGFLDIFINLN